MGMGGGCDVFAACSFAHQWSAENPGATVLFANCVGPRPLPDDHTALTPHLYRLPAETVPLSAGDEAYGSTRLEQSVPRGMEGSPFLVTVPRSGKDDGTVEELSSANTAAIGGALTALHVDQVLAIDLGGDSLTGGRDFARDAELGRDRQVLHALRSSCRAGALPGGVVHIVLGPGCDGETPIDAMRAAVRGADERGELLGAMPRLGGTLPMMAQLAGGLSASRTPNILAAAMARADANEAVWDDTALCTITRHGHTESVPWAWLTVGLALRL